MERERERLLGDHVLLSECVCERVSVCVREREKLLGDHVLLQATFNRLARYSMLCDFFIYFYFSFRLPGRELQDCSRHGYERDLQDILCFVNFYLFYF